MYFKETFSIVCHKLLKILLYYKFPKKNGSNVTIAMPVLHLTLLKFHTNCFDYQIPLANFIVRPILIDSSKVIWLGS